MGAAQSARLTEVLDFLHRGIATQADGIRVPEGGERITMPIADWLKIQAVQTLLSHYCPRRRGAGWGRVKVPSFISREMLAVAIYCVIAF